ncbi:hypothetical protein AURDEDRAFT_162134 [Auricularia subglabra TFB-10046 SS5]|nr:hypothetical protein AURDEDRAFT_162134 [Auricularia subglabra TFB-10046 SS5]
MDQPATSLRGRLDADEQLLAGMRRELESLVGQRDIDRLALVTLQDKVSVSDADIADLTARQAALQESINRRRATLAPRSLPTFPLEVLGFIFSLATDVPAVECGAPTIVTERTLQPFKFAAVCMRWHHAALATSYVWTYIGIPGHIQGARLPVWRSRVQQLLERSRACNLCVDIESPPNGFDDQYMRILSDILPHCSRWQSLCLRAYKMTLDRAVDVLRLLRGPTPSLETLIVAFQTPAPPSRHRSELPKYIPYAPKLRTVHIEYAPIAFERQGSDRLAATSLALIEQSYDLARFFKTVLSFSALSSLTLYWAPVKSVSVAQPSDIVLAELRCLVVTRDRADNSAHASFSPILDVIVAPRLSELQIIPYLLSDAGGLLRRCAASIEVLVFHRGCLEDAEEIHDISLLTELRELSLDSCGMTEGFLDALTEVAPTVWPKLQRLVLTDAEELDPDAFVRFLQARYPAEDTRAAPACALLEVDLEADSLRYSVASGEIALILENERRRRAVPPPP